MDVTVITISYNSADDLYKTIQSVRNQSSENFEFIIIDGGSNDHSFDVIQKNLDIIDIWVSEKDAGIYDAMNKGVKLASGDSIVFMNAGDLFFNDTVIEFISSQISNYKKPSVLFGNHMVDSNGNLKKRYSNNSIDEIWKGMIFCHQSSFVSRSLLIKYPFDVDLKIGSDFKFFCKIVNKAEFVRIDKFLSIVTSGGVSDIRRVDSVLERKNIVSDIFGYNFFRSSFYNFMVLNELVKLLIKKFIFRCK